MNLLSIDFDYFVNTEPKDATSDYYEWGSSEFTPALLQDVIWHHRAAAFLSAGLDLPGLDPDPSGFWGRFQITPGARLIVGDSHALIYHAKVRRGVLGVTSYDAHHDGGYGMTPEEFRGRGLVECDTWAFAYELAGVPVRIVLPPWRDGSQEVTARPSLLDALGCGDRREIDPGGPDPVVYDRVFICRSSTWLPTWLDGAFFSFLRDCPVPDGRRAFLGPLEPRAFHRDSAEEMSLAMKKLSTAASVGGRP